MGGEAKRRQEINREMLNLRRWIDDFRNMQHTGQYDANVPCGTCRACCYHPGVYVDKNVENTEDLERMALVQDEIGWKIPKRDDGGCIHLTKKGCGIYKNRPQACRAFDCRMFTMCGVRLHLKQKVPVWKINPTNASELFFLFSAIIAIRWVVSKIGTYSGNLPFFAVPMALEFLQILIPEYHKLEQTEQTKVLVQGSIVWQRVQDQLNQDVIDVDTLSMIFDVWSFLSDDTITKIRELFETRVEQCRSAGEI